jgi:prepilin-type N-terminal cleavage/methylation domain-containing protein
MNKQKGFTLIELLVVIAIIALLMSIYFAMYADDYDGRFMRGFTASPQANRWVSALGDYYKWDDEFTCCPNAYKPWVDEYGVNSGAEGSALGVGVTMAWGYMNQGHWKKPMKGSYGINGWCVDPQPGKNWFWRGPTVAGAGYVPLFLEAQRYNGWALQTDRPPSYSGERWNDDAQMGRYCLNRHDGFAGCLFLDYSARKVGLKELWTLKWHKEYNEAGPWTLGGGVLSSDWPEWMQHLKDY